MNYNDTYHKTDMPNPSGSFRPTLKGRTQVLKLYVVAPMTGIPQFNYPLIQGAGQVLKDAGYGVVTPIDEDPPEVREAALASLTGDWQDLPSTFTMPELIRDNVETVLNADGLATLPGVKNSKGAKLEIAVAERLGMPVAPVEWWLNQGQYGGYMT